MDVSFGGFARNVSLGRYSGVNPELAEGVLSLIFLGSGWSEFLTWTCCQPGL